MGLLVLLVLVVLFGWLMLATIGLAFGLLLTLLVAGLVGWAADMVVPGRLPGGWIGAVLAGLIGGFIGRMLFHALGCPSGMANSALHRNHGRARHGEIEFELRTKTKRHRIDRLDVCRIPVGALADLLDGRLGRAPAWPP